MPQNANHPRWLIYRVFFQSLKWILAQECVCFDGVCLDVWYNHDYTGFQFPSIIVKTAAFL